MTVKRTKSDAFMLRLPEGLRDRVKVHAEAHGRSMNTEIVRLLEREFPEPWTLDERAIDLLRLTKILKDGTGGEIVDQLKTAIHDTLRGIVVGRVVGVDEETRARVGEQLDRYERDAAEDEFTRKDFDDDELDAYGETPKVNS